METPRIKKNLNISEKLWKIQQGFFKKIATKYRAWQLQHGIYFDKFISNKIFTDRSYKYRHETHKHKLVFLAAETVRLDNYSIQ